MSFHGTSAHISRTGIALVSGASPALCAQGSQLVEIDMATRSTTVVEQRAILVGGIGFMLVLLAGLASKPKDAIGAVLFLVLIVVMTLVKRKRVAAVAVVINVVLVVLIPIFSIHSFGALKYAIPAACAVASAIAVIRRGGVHVFKAPGIAALFIPFLALTWVVTAQNHDSFGPRNLLIFTVLMLPVLGLSSILSAGERRTVFKWIVGMAAFESLIAIGEQLHKTAPIWGYQNVTATFTGSRQHSEIFTSLFRSQGTLFSPLPLAFLLVIAFGLLSTKLLTFENARRRFALLVLLLGATVLVGSRSALVTELLVIIFTAGKQRSWGINRVLLLAVLSVLLVISIFGFNVGHSTVVNNFTGSYSVSQRQDSISSVPKLLTEQSEKDEWLGNGYYSEARMFTTGLLPTDGFTAIDDQLVTTLSESGIIGSLLMIALYILAMARTNRQMRVVLVSALGVFFAFDIFLWPSSTVLMAVILGISLSGRKVEEPSSPFSHSDSSSLLASVSPILD